MSFMSFEYARQAADAAIQFHTNQGQNIKSVNDSVKTVGTANAKRKDDLMRQKIEAEYTARSAEIKAEKAEALMKLAEERKENAQKAAFIVGIGTFAGGMLDGIMDMAKGDENEMPEFDQVSQMSDAQIMQNATSFKIAAGTGNSEVGAIAAYNPDQGNFSLVKVNTTTGRVDGFVNLSQTQMAEELLAATNGSDDPSARAINSFLTAGPPPAFKAEAFKEGTSGELDTNLENALFADNGFFAKGSRVGINGDDSGENMVGRLLANPRSLNSSYTDSAKGIMNLLENDRIRQGMSMTEDAVDNSRKIMKDEKALGGGLGKAGEGFNKLLFKPLGTSLNQFMKMAQVAKQYEEEYNEKMAEYNAAKKQAAAAREKLQKLEGLLAAGSSS